MRPRELAALLLLGLTVAAPAAAQYKWVGPDGEVTYSDRPPPAGTSAVTLSVQSAAGRRDDAGLPAALREPASRHPVVLYTTGECAPCQMARTHLNRRGVPYAERTVSTAADAEAFRRAGFQEVTMPGLGVGRERTTGYEASAWDRLLDAAGYPKSSMLPASYRQQPPVALAPQAAAPEAPRPEGASAPERAGADGAPVRARLPEPRREAQAAPAAGNFRF